MASYYARTFSHAACCLPAILSSWLALFSAHVSGPHHPPRPPQCCYSRHRRRAGRITTSHTLVQVRAGCCAVSQHAPARDMHGGVLFHLGAHVQQRPLDARHGHLCFGTRLQRVCSRHRPPHQLDGHRFLNVWASFLFCHLSNFHMCDMTNSLASHHHAHCHGVSTYESLHKTLQSIHAHAREMAYTC